jgi:hypothetical protein
MSKDTDVILTDETIAEVSYVITSWGAPESGPSFSGPGEPAEPPEFEIEKITINGKEVTLDDLSEKDQEKIDEAIYEQLADGPDDYDEY